MNPVLKISLIAVGIALCVWVAPAVVFFGAYVIRGLGGY